MNTPTIRPARPGDEAAIHAAHMRSINEICVKDHGPEEVRGWGNRPLGDRWKETIKTGYVWVVELGGQIQGHGCIKIAQGASGSTAHIHGLYLTPEVLGFGIGNKLMELMLAQARSLGATEITLGSTITAHDFYKKYGFKDSGPIEKHEIGGYPVTCYPMSLTL